jgi:hypothetical protein
VAEVLKNIIVERERGGGVLVYRYWNGREKLLARKAVFELVLGICAAFMELTSGKTGHELVVHFCQCYTHTYIYIL